MSEITIWCNNRHEYMELANVLDTRGYGWAVDHRSCSEYTPYTEWHMNPAEGICLHLDVTHHIVTYSLDQHNDDMTVAEFKVQEGVERVSFEKANLENEMIVKLRNGQCYMYFKSFDTLVRDNSFVTMDNFSDDLICVDDATCDIVAVYVPSTLTSFDFLYEYRLNHLVQVWERPKDVTMTVAQIEEKLGIRNLKIIDKDV